MDPIPADLSAIHRRQLEILEQRYAGRPARCDAILARTGEGDDDEGILPAHTARLMVVDDWGTPRFDAWLTMGDSGAVFAVGTDQIVAEMVQGGVESGDRGLRLSLPEVLSFKAPKKTTPAPGKTTKKKP